MVFKILIVDDEESVGFGISSHLAKDGYQTSWVKSGEEALEKLRGEDFHLVFLDLFLTGLSGLSVLERIKKEFPETLVIILTAYGNVKMAVQAMKIGAFDYLTKSSDMTELRLMVKKALETKKLRKEIKILRAEIDRRHERMELVGNGIHMHEIRHLIQKVSRIDRFTILVIGESGTGKELVAKTIHRKSVRAKNSFIDISCSALPNSLMESELFGFEKGAFTGAKNKKLGLIELADGGTLFLDEISTLDLSTQAKLLRFLEQRTFRRVGGVKDVSVNINVITASNTDLNKMVEKGTFRRDLFYRLNVFLVRVPPLRERKEDIPLLVHHFIQKFNQDFHKNIQGIQPDALDIIMEYNYPGNIRELRNIIERAMIMEEEEMISIHSLDFLRNVRADISGIHYPVLDNVAKEASKPEKIVPLKEMERCHILRTLKITNNNKAKTAEILGIARSTLFKKIKEYSIND